jgi:putative flippase GtrA
MQLKRELLRFLAVSGLQAVANYGTYLIVLQFAPWWIAFMLAVVVGLTLQTLLQIRTTFGENVTARRSFRYVGYQIAYLVVFMILLKTVIEFGVRAEFAPLIVLAGVTPINFLLTRWVIRLRPDAASARSSDHGR